jgi:hypothetical protein
MCALDVTHLYPVSVYLPATVPVVVESIAHTPLGRLEGSDRDKSSDVHPTRMSTIFFGITRGLLSKCSIAAACVSLHQIVSLRLTIRSLSACARHALRRATHLEVAIISRPERRQTQRL